MKTQNTIGAIAVCGATGKQGGAVAYELLSRGHQVRAFTRNPLKESARALSEAGAEIIKVDLEKPEDIQAALEGAYGVYSVQDFLEAGVEAEVRQGMNLLQAAVQLNTKHLIYTGASTMDRNTGVPHLDSKWQIEQAIRESGLDFTLFRPSAFLENWEWDRDSIKESKTISMPMRPEMTYKQISVKDTASLVAIAFEQPSKWKGQIASLAGDNLTPNQIASVFSKVLGTNINYQQMTWEQCLAEQGEELTAMYRYFEDYGMNGEPNMLEHWGGTRTSLEDYLTQNNW